MLYKIKEQIDFLIKNKYNVEINNNFESILLYHKVIMESNKILNYYWFEFEEKNQSKVYENINDLFKNIEYFFSLNNEFKNNNK